MTVDVYDDSPSVDGVVGITLAERYRIVAAMDLGGMGVIYRAWDLIDSRYVVVKFPRENVSVERFVREMAVLGRIDHPHVVPILASGDYRGRPYAVMPYLAGGDLSKRRPQFRGKPVPAHPSQLLTWLPPVAGALDHIHRNGFLHRDVKPSNILFDGRASPFLGDFGVAKILRDARMDDDHSITEGRATLGTPDYICPHLISTGAATDGRSDQYGLAVVIYELLAARKPTTGPNPTLKLLAALQHDPPSLWGLRSDLPVSLCEAVHRALSKRPEDRFDSCGDFAACVLADIPHRTLVQKRRLVCPGCGILLVVEDAQLRTLCRCPKCRRMMDVTGEPGLILRTESDPSALIVTEPQAPTLAPATGPEVRALWRRIWPSGSRGRAAVMASAIVGTLGVGAMVLYQKAGTPTALPVAAKLLDSPIGPTGVAIEEIGEKVVESVVEEELLPTDEPQVIDADDGGITINLDEGWDQGPAAIEVEDHRQDDEDERPVDPDAQVAVPRDPPLPQLEAEVTRYVGLLERYDLLDAERREKEGTWVLEDGELTRMRKDIAELEKERDDAKKAIEALRVVQPNENIDVLRIEVARKEESLRRSHALRLDKEEVVQTLNSDHKSCCVNMQRECIDIFEALPRVLEKTDCFSRTHETESLTRALAAGIEGTSRKRPWEEQIVRKKPTPILLQQRNVSCLRYPLMLVTSKIHLDIVNGDAESARTSLEQSLNAMEWIENEIPWGELDLPEHRQVELVWPVQCAAAYAFYLLESSMEKEAGRPLPSSTILEGKANKIRSIVGFNSPKNTMMNHPVAVAVTALGDRIQGKPGNASKSFQQFLEGRKKARPARHRGLKPLPDPKVGDALLLALVGEAAWFFAAAPERYRDLVRARALVDELVPHEESTSWLGWRARAALRAHAGDWDGALEDIERAAPHAPKVFDADIARQRRSYLERQTFELPSPRSRR